MCLSAAVVGVRESERETEQPRRRRNRTEDVEVRETGKRRKNIRSEEGESVEGEGEGGRARRSSSRGESDRPHFVRSLAEMFRVLAQDPQRPHLWEEPGIDGGGASQQLQSLQNILGICSYMYIHVHVHCIYIHRHACISIRENMAAIKKYGFCICDFWQQTAVCVMYMYHICILTGFKVGSWSQITNAQFLQL